MQMNKYLELDSGHSNIITKLASHGFNEACSYSYLFNAIQLKHAAVSMQTIPYTVA